MASKARKRVNAAMRQGRPLSIADAPPSVREAIEAAEGILVVPAAYRRDPLFSFGAVLLASVGASRLRQIPRVKVPDACAGCIYRQPEMRDGGWCHMWREQPASECHLFEARAARPAAGPAQGGGGRE